MPLVDIEQKSALEELQEAHKGKLVVVQFYASWCDFCISVAPTVVELAQNFPDVAFARVDVDEASDLSDDYQVTSTPKFVFMRDGEIVDVYTKIDGHELRVLIEKNMP